MTHLNRSAPPSTRNIPIGARTWIRTSGSSSSHPIDPVVSATLDELILRLRDAMNMTIVVVTHEIESALGIADRITVLDQGRVLAVDTVAGLRQSANPRIQNLLNRRPEVTEVDPALYLSRLTGEA